MTSFESLLEHVNLQVPDRRRIIIVDDEPDNLAVLEALLDVDCEVHCANNGREALKLLDNLGDAELIITDQRMPGMTGVELLAKVRQWWPEVVQMVVTGYSDIGPILTALQDGSVYRFLLKPWEPEEIRAAVNGAVQMKQMRIALPSVVSTLLQKRDASRQAIDQLAKTQDQLIAAERLATLGRITSGITHDIRNNLNVMVAIAEAAKEDSKDLILVDAASAAVDSLEAILCLVSDVHAFARKSPRDDERSQIDAVSFMEETLRYFSFETKERPRTVDIKIDPEVSELHIHRQRVRQALLALLRNAALALESNSKPIKLHCYAKESTVCIEVRDEGCGMDYATLEKAKAPFFTAFNPPGMGLGLEIARLVAEDHGGELVLESRCAEGTVARLTVGAAVL
jgi:two-component system, NtrC family, sensor kinase